MPKRDALVSMVVLVVVLLACKKGEQLAASSQDASTVAATPTASSAVAATTFKVGDSVDVEWSGSWYESQVLAVEPGPKYKIHYVGWSDSYDETVEPSRVRARSGAASTTTTASASASSTASAAPHASTTGVIVVPGNKIGEEAPTHGKCLTGWVVAEEACHRPCTKDSDCAPPTSFCKKWEGKKLCARTGSLVVPND